MSKTKKQLAAGAFRITANTESHTKRSIAPYGFTASHFMFIAVALLALLGFGVTNGSLTLEKLSNLNPLHAAAEEQKSVTYDQLRAQVDASFQPLSTENPKTQEQLAEVDPTYGLGEVLGAATDAAIPSADSIFTPDKINQVAIHEVNKTAQADLSLYAQQLSFIENYYGSSTLLQVFTSQDTQQLQQAQQSYTALIADLKKMDVPTPFVTYQRYKILYYASLADMAQSMAGQTTTTSSAGVLFLSLQSKLDEVRVQLIQQYNVAL